MDHKIPNYLPTYDWFGPDYSLHPQLEGRFDNKNSKKYLESVKEEVLEQLRFLNYAPSVQQTEIPPDITGLTEEEDRMLEELNKETEEGMAMTKLKDEARVGELLE